MLERIEAARELALQLTQVRDVRLAQDDRSVRARRSEHLHAVIAALALEPRVMRLLAGAPREAGLRSATLARGQHFGA